MAVIGFASCTSDEYLGENSPNASQQTEGAINFGGGAGNITRATSNTGTVAQMLDGQMKIFGVKGETTTPAFTTVFNNYKLWNTASVTTSNPDGDWEYVGAAGTYGTVTLTAAQYIKYWDYGTEEYHFVAGSPVSCFTYALDGDGDIATASVTGLAGHINPNTSGTGITTNPVYIAAPVKVVKTNYQQDVTFQFTRQQSFVRVGVFENIPGYSISAISFYPYGDAGWAATPDANHNIVLASTTANYFRGSANGTATLTYEWTTPSYTFDYTAATLTQAKNWYGGALASGVPAESSTATVANLYGTDDDMVTSTGYFTVIPMASESTAQPILIKCDYTLTALDGSETINVKGATAAIPAAFCKWAPNTSYTYLFKISDNTNGTTGTVGSDPEGLFPITFDAAVIAEEDAAKQGYITTVSTPSITTYQVGSVKAAGIQYTVAQGAIYFTAQNDETGDLLTLGASNYGTPATGQVQVYKVPAGTTEADLILTRPAEANKFSTGGGGSAWTINGQTVPAAKWASFTPDAAGTYAIEYATSASSFAYKIVVVE